VPLAVVARTNRWSLGRVARVSALASSGHVLASLGLAGVLAIIGLQLQAELEMQQGRIIGAVLIANGLALGVWGRLAHGHDHGPGGHSHAHGHPHEHPAGAPTLFEWAGIYELEAGSYQFQLAAGPDSTMQVALLPVAAATRDALGVVEQQAAALFAA